MKRIGFILFLCFFCVHLAAQENEYEGIYYSKKIRKRGGFSCYSLNENQTILHVIISVGSFNDIWEEKYVLSGDTITTEEGWVIIPSKYKKANPKMINRIETRIGKLLNGYGYCIHKNFILRCNEITLCGLDLWQNRKIIFSGARNYVALDALIEIDKIDVRWKTVS